MVRLAKTPQDLERVFAIRHQVFVQEQGVPADEEHDSHDAQATHWLVWHQDQAVATARLVRYPEEQGKIGRVAVLQPWRGQKVGQTLMQAIHQWVDHQPLNKLILDAQLAVIPFYERLGYQAEGEIFDDCGILHRRMVRWLA
jgi:predicted GNAT family N-acyltransferase